MVKFHSFIVHHYTVTSGEVAFRPLQSHECSARKAQSTLEARPIENSSSSSSSRYGGAIEISMWLCRSLNPKLQTFQFNTGFSKRATSKPQPRAPRMQVLELIGISSPRGPQRSVARTALQEFCFCWCLCLSGFSLRERFRCLL